MQREEDGQVGEGDGLQADNAADGAEGFQELGGDEGLGASRSGEAGEFKLGLGWESGADRLGTRWIAESESGGDFFAECRMRVGELGCQWMRGITQRNEDDWFSRREGPGDRGRINGRGGFEQEKDDVRQDVCEGVLDMLVGRVVSRIEDFQSASGSIRVFAPALDRFLRGGVRRSKQSQKIGNACGSIADEFEARCALGKEDRADRFELPENRLVDAAGQFFQKP